MWAWGRCAALLLASLPCLVVSWPSLAQSPADAPPDASGDPAQAAFQGGVEAFDAGDYAAALARFRASYRLRAAPRVLYNVAVTERLLGRTADACRDLVRYLRDIDALAPERRASIEQELASWSAHVARLELVVAPGGAAVRLDGRELGTSPLAEPLFLDPGEHDVSVERAGFAAAEHALRLRAGEHRRLVVRLRREPRASEVPGPSRAATRGAEPRGRERAGSAGVLASPWLWAVVGVVATGAIVTAIALGSSSEPDGSRLTITSPFALSSDGGRAP